MVDGALRAGALQQPVQPVLPARRVFPVRCVNVDVGELLLVVVGDRVVLGADGGDVDHDRWLDVDVDDGGGSHFQGPADTGPQA